MKQPKTSYLTLPAAISKAQIAEYIALQGHANAAPLTIDGKVYSPGSVQFVSFAGGLDLSDELYHGDHQFLAGKFPDAPASDLNQLPGLAPVKQSRKKGDSDGV